MASDQPSLEARAEALRNGAQATDLGHRFAYHSPSGERNVRHTIVRDTLLEAALTIAGLTKPGREQSTAFTKLEEAMFWANAAIAREP